MLCLAIVDSLSKGESYLHSTYYVLFLLHSANAESLRQHRYSFRKRYRSSYRAANTYLRDLATADDSTADTPPWLNDTEFLEKYRMSRDAFNYVLAHIQDDPVFQKGQRGREQRPVAYQLMTTLKALGTEGSGFSNPSLRHVFHTGRGTSTLYMDRVVTALRNLKQDFLHWPEDDAKKTIKSAIEELSGLPNCVGIIDGTMFPLGFEPETDDSGDYNGRKYKYSLTFLICCDHRRLITYYYGGWPGCTHDNKMFRYSQMYRNPEQFFKHNEYMIGDSAFENQWFSVAAYPKPPGGNMQANKSVFNTQMSKARVISEHTIGLLKGRFPWLRSIRKKISKDVAHARSLLRYIDATIILHNMLVLHGDAELEDGWDDPEDDATAIDDFESLPEDDELNLPVPPDAPPDARRLQLTHYLVETFGH